MTEITIVLLGEPVAWARAAGGRSVRLFTPTKQRNNAAALRLLAQAEMQGREPLSGPVVGMVTAEFAIPATMPKYKKKLAECGNIWPTKKPDLSNICKQIEDACNGVIFADDSQIVRYDVLQKRYGRQPKVTATFRALEEIA